MSEKDYLDPKQNPFIAVGDEDNPGGVPMIDEERAAVDMNPEGLAPCDLSPDSTKIKDFMKGRSFFAIYQEDQFLFSVKLDEAGKIMLESASGSREPSQDELRQIAQGIDKREG